jgi:putative heme iron utilization protein
MSRNQVESPDIAGEARQLIARFRTLLLATADAGGVPHASYAPFVRADDGCFHIYISGLARHTRNLQATGRASVLIIEDERGADQPFARRRLTLECSAEPIARGTPEWHSILDAFAAEFGEIMAPLRELPDFTLFRLTPQSAVYVRGFGQAYRLNGRLEVI